MWLFFVMRNLKDEVAILLSLGTMSPAWLKDAQRRYPGDYNPESVGRKRRC